MINIKNADEIRLMKNAGRLAAKVLDSLAEIIRPGVSTMELEHAAAEIIRSGGGTPSFKGYRGYPAGICASINEEVVHGIPSPDRILSEGDIIGVDVGVLLHGMHADTARTYAVGRISAKDQKLIQAAEESFRAGLQMATAGMRIGDISAAIEKKAGEMGCTVVRELVGHGVGRALHEEPDVPNFGRAGHGVRLCEGMTIAIEPMLSAGKEAVRFMPDGWTVVVADGSKSSHFEHTIAITKGEPEILTLP